MELTFRVVTLGLHPHRDSQVIRNQLPKLFTGDPTGVGTIIDRILSNQPVVLAKNIPHENAENLLRVLTDLGLKCRIEPMQLTLAPIEEEKVSVYQCPACGYKQPASKEAICRSCGVAIKKYQDYQELKAALELERQRSRTVTLQTQTSWNLGSIVKKFTIIGVLGLGISGIWHWQNSKTSPAMPQPEMSDQSASATTPKPPVNTEVPTPQSNPVLPSPPPTPAPAVAIPTPSPAPVPKLADPRSVLASATDLKPIAPSPAPVTQPSPPVPLTPAAVIPPPPLAVTPTSLAPQTPPPASNSAVPTTNVGVSNSTAISSFTGTSTPSTSRKTATTTTNTSRVNIATSDNTSNNSKSASSSKNQAATNKSEQAATKNLVPDPGKTPLSTAPNALSDPNLINNLAKYKAVMGDVGAAQQALNQLNKLSEDYTKDFSSEQLDTFNSTRIETLAAVANQHYKQKQISTAQELWLQAINLTNSLKSSNERALAFSSLGRSLHSSNTATARNYFKRAEETALLISDPALRTTTLSTLARDLALTGRSDQSRELFARVQTATAALPNQLARLIAMSVTAQHLAEVGDATTAKSLLDEIDNANIASPPMALVEHRLQAQGAIAYHLARNGDPVTARTQFLATLDTAVSLQPTAARDKVLLYVAERLGRAGDTKLAEEIVTQVLRGDTAINYSSNQSATNSQ